MKHQQNLTLGDFLTAKTKEQINKIEQKNSRKNSEKNSEKKSSIGLNMRNKISQVTHCDELADFEDADLNAFLSQKVEPLTPEERERVNRLREHSTWLLERELEGLFKQLKQYQETYDMLMTSLHQEPGKYPLTDPVWDCLGDGKRLRRAILELRVWLNLIYEQCGISGIHCNKK